MTYQRMTSEDKEIVLQMYKAHYTAKEVAELFPFGYGTIIMLFRAWKSANIEKYDRTILLKEATNDA